MDETKDDMLIVAVDSSFPPMEFMDENGDLSGFDIDFAEALAEEMGVGIEFINVSWDQIFMFMYAGECDVIISSVTITNDRREAMDFSIPYFRGGQVILSTTDVAGKIENESDLEGLKIGVATGTIAEMAAQSFSDTVDFELIQYSDIDVCLEAMAAGEVDCIAINMLFALNIILNNPDIYSISDFQLTSSPIAIAMNKNMTELETEINEAIIRLQQSGAMAEL